MDGYRRGNVRKMPELMQTPDMPSIPGLAVPCDFYWVLQQPAPLAGMPYPSPCAPWLCLAAAGFRHVICVEGHGPAYDPSPLRISHRTTLQDLYGGSWPRHPEQEESRIHEAAQAVVTRLQTAEGVVVHCAGGTGRTGTVIGCVLRTLGFSAGEVIDYLNHLHQDRGRSCWPESAWQSEVIQRFPGSEGIWRTSVRV